MTAVAFVGLGSMGLPMAANLVAKRFAVAGFDTGLRRATRSARRAAGRRRTSLTPLPVPRS